MAQEAIAFRDWESGWYSMARLPVRDMLYIELAHKYTAELGSQYAIAYDHADGLNDYIWLGPAKDETAAVATFIQIATRIMEQENGAPLAAIASLPLPGAA